MVTECCSESRMRSWTSRGLPEWSGGKDLYRGSPVLVTGKVSGFIGNVPGPPGGSRGSTKWGHRPRRSAWGKCGRGPAPGGLVRPPPQGPKAPKGRKGANPKGRWALGPMPGAPPSPPPLGRHPRWDWGWPPPLGWNPRWGAPLPLPYIYLRTWGCQQMSSSPS